MSQATAHQFEWWEHIFILHALKVGLAGVFALFFAEALGRISYDISFSTSSIASAGEARSQLITQLYKRARPVVGKRESSRSTSGVDSSNSYSIFLFPENEVLDHLPLLEPLSDAEKAHLNAQISRRHFQAGEQLLAQDQRVESVHFVFSGVIQITRQVTTWAGERVRVELTPSLRAESIRYVANYDQVFLANSLRQRGLSHEYKISGKGTPLVVYTKNPESTPQEKPYPSTGITLGLTAVEEERPAQMPLLKLYDAFDPTVVRSSSGPDPIAANYTATLVVLDSYARKVAGGAAGSFLRPDNPRFATGIYLIHPYDPNKPSIERVIFLARPHRGSGLASGIVGSIAS